MANPAAQTAIGPMVIVAFDQYDPHPLVRDDLAARLLPGATRGLVGLARWRPVRRAVAAMTEKQVPGLWASILCRKRYADDVVRLAVADGVTAAVILGAGMDTRAYRLPELAGLPVFEVDLPANVERKRALLTGVYGAPPAHVTLVPVDFDTEDPAARLAAAGYDPARPTVFVWEAVTQYLTDAGVRATLAFLAAAPAGSHLVFTHIRQDFLDGTDRYGADVAYRRFVTDSHLWRFGLDPAEVPGLLAGYGWRQVEQAGPAELTARYLEPAGRPLPVTEIERSVHARKD
ncbi:methyltransferase [Pseudonocardia sp. CNS-139]|nr:methyltransferase [Pseudonocardia sp. CNS-139]